MCPPRPQYLMEDSMKTATSEVSDRIRILRAACICAEAVQWMKDEDRREVLKETQKILGCGEKVECSPSA